jgi:hypothetical protein
MGFHKPQAGKAHAKVLLYGTGGVGKTHAGLTFPKPAVIDTEGGTAFFAGRSDAGLQSFEVSEERSYLRIIEDLEGIERGAIDCDTIVIDSITSIYNVLNLALSDNGKKALRPMDWGLLKARFKAVLDFAYDALPKHIVLTAHEKPEYAKEGAFVNGRKVQANELVPLGFIPDCDAKAIHACDFVFRLTVDDQGRRWAECIKSRHPHFVKGERYANLAWASFAPLVAGGAVRITKTDAQVASEDAAALGVPPDEFEPIGEERPASAKEIAEELKALSDSGFADEVRAALIHVFGEAKIPRGATKEKVLAALEAAHAARDAKSAAVASARPAVATEPGVATEPPARQPDPSLCTSDQRKKIKALQREAQLDDDGYRVFIDEVAPGKRSSLDITVEQASALIDRLQALVDSIAA